MKEYLILALTRQLLEAEAGDEALRDMVRLGASVLLVERLFEGVPTHLEAHLPQGIRELMVHRKALPEWGHEVEVDLAHHPAVSFPWNLDRMAGAAMRIQRWRYHEDNHRAVIYRPLGLVLFYNGLHSGTVGVLRREGVLPAQEVDLGEAYASGLRVVWKEGMPIAEFAGFREAFESPGYGLLWAMGQLLWERGRRL